jgi:hypothetical protein
LVSVTADSVRDLVHLTVDDVPDAKVTEFLTQAAAEISIQTDLSIDYNDCTQGETAAVRLLATFLLSSCQAHLQKQDLGFRSF